MIGAFDSATACIIEPFDGCETSTMMPHLFISAITCLPSGLRPPHCPLIVRFAGVRVRELAVAVVRERHVARRRDRRTPSRA